MEEKQEYLTEEQQEFLGIMILGFFMSFIHKDIPTIIKDIVEKYIREDGSIVDEKKMIEEVRPYLIEYYKLLKDKY